MLRRNLFCTEPGGKQAADVHKPHSFRDANTGAGQGFTDLTAVVQLRLRVRVRVASIAAMQRSLKPQSTGRHRGDPRFQFGEMKKEECRMKKQSSRSSPFLHFSFFLLHSFPHPW